MKKLLSLALSVLFCAVLAVPAFALDATEVKSTSDPLSEAPVMKHVQKVGPVTFSNYVSHTEDGGYDAYDNPISGYIVTIGIDGCMKTEEADSDFIWYVVEFNFDGGEGTKYSVKTDEVYVPVPGSFNTLNVWDIETYADGRAEDGTWPGGLVWQFKEDKTNGSDDGEYKDVKRIKAVINGVDYYYIVRVVNTEVFADTPESQIPKEPAKNATATPTSAKVYIDGKQIAFEAYNINGNNYFKLRDLAAAFKGTEKEFGIVFNPDYEECYWPNDQKVVTAKGKVEMHTFIPYQLTGNELKPGDGKAKPAVLSNMAFGIETEYKSDKIPTNAYNIGGNNFVKIRDICNALDCSIEWDGANQAMRINTAERYNHTV